MEKKKYIRFYFCQSRPRDFLLFEVSVFIVLFQVHSLESRLKEKECALESATRELRQEERRIQVDDEDQGFAADIALVHSLIIFLKQRRPANLERLTSLRILLFLHVIA